MMGILDLIANTIEGVAQTAINTTKAAVGVAIAPMDDAETLVDAGDGIADGLNKIGKSDLGVQHRNSRASQN